MKTKWILAAMCLMSALLWADETITVTATSSDVSENLNLKTVASLFGQVKDLDEFEQLLNNPDSAYSNLDLNGDGDVDYLRVVETADGNKHLVVIQAVLAKDIYQDVASIYVEKDEAEQVVVQVVGDEYVYGVNYIIEPVYIYRPLIYDWFWGPSWVCWHSPYYWGYYPHWWHTWHCIDPYLYWDHCYWHHYHHPWCSYRTAHHHRPHYRTMYDRVRRDDLAVRHPERSFGVRNASRNILNARALETGRRAEMSKSVSPARSAAVGTRSGSTTTRVSTTGATRNSTYGSTNVRTAGSTTRSTAAGTAVRTTGSTTRSAAAGTAVRTTGSTTRSTTTSTAVRTTGNTTRSTSTGTAVRTTGTTSTSRSASTSATRSSSPSVSRSSSSSSSSAVRTSSSSSSVRSGSTSAVRSSSSSVSRSSGYGGGSVRTSSGSSSSRSGGSVRR
jgi:hypothetical protein